MTAIATHPAYEHVAVLHHGAADLARRLAPMVSDALARNEAVLVCLDPAGWRSLADELGTDADRITFMPAGERYRRPAQALAVLSRFVQDALRSGAPAVWSIGAIGFDGSDQDDRWIRYEAAIDDVIGHLPLRAVCAYDVTVLPDDILEGARVTHAILDDDRGRRPSADYHRRAEADVRSATTPTGDPDVDVESDEAGATRRALDAAYRKHLPADRLSDLKLVATELVTNAIRHGAPPIRLRAWLRARTLTLQVTDKGPGIGHPFPELRPPEPSTEGGYGMWLVGQLSDDVVVDRRQRGAVVTATLAV